MELKIEFQNLDQVYEILSLYPTIKNKTSIGMDNLYQFHDNETFAKWIKLKNANVNYREILLDALRPERNGYLFPYEDIALVIMNASLAKELDVDIQHLEDLEIIVRYPYLTHYRLFHFHPRQGDNYSKEDYDKLVNSVQFRFMIDEINKFPTYRTDIVTFLYKTQYETDGDEKYLYLVMDHINPDFLENVEDDTKNTTFYKDWIKARAGKGVLDTTIGLRGTGIPSLAIENIASHLYDTTGFTAYQLMNIIGPITEYKNQRVVGANTDVYDEQEYIDV